MDADYADDVALLSINHSYLQEVMTRLQTFAQQTDLHICKSKTKVMNTHLVSLRSPLPRKW